MNRKRFIPLLETEFAAIIAANDAKMMLVFLAIKKHFRWKTRNNSFPSYDTIAKESNVSRRTAIRKCETLKRIGVLDWESRATKHQSNIYSFPMEDGAKPVALPTTREMVSPEAPMVSPWTNDGAKSGTKRTKDGAKPVAHQLDNNLTTHLTKHLTRSGDNEEFRDITQDIIYQSQNLAIGNSSDNDIDECLKDMGFDEPEPINKVRSWNYRQMDWLDECNAEPEIIDAKDVINYCGDAIIIDETKANKELNLLTGCFDTAQELLKYLDWAKEKGCKTWEQLISTKALLAWQQLQGHYR